MSFDKRTATRLMNDNNTDELLSYCKNTDIDKTEAFLKEASSTDNYSAKYV